MLNCVLERILIKLESLKKTAEIAPGIEIEIVNNAQMEKRLQASVTEGIVISVGPTAYADYKLSDGSSYNPVKVGDKVVFAKYAARPITDPDSPDEELALINDEDVLAVITSKGDANE